MTRPQVTVCGEQNFTCCIMHITMNICGCLYFSIIFVCFAMFMRLETLPSDLRLSQLDKRSICYNGNQHYLNSVGYAPGIFVLS